METWKAVILQISAVPQVAAAIHLCLQCQECDFENIHLTASFSTLFCPVSTFVPKKGIAPPTPKAVSGLKNGSSRRSSMRNDIKMMPIGVPKVAYRVPGGAGAEW